MIDAQKKRNLLQINLKITNMKYLAVFSFFIFSFAHAQSKYELNEQARLHMYAHDYESAIKDYTQIIHQFPADTMAYFDRAFVKQIAEDFTGSILDFTQAIKLDSSNPDSYFLRGNSKLELKDWLGAVQDYAASLVIEPINPDVYYFKGFANYWARHYKESVVDLNRSVELETDKLLEAYFFLSKANRKMGNWRDANKACNIGRKLKQDNIHMSCFCFKITQKKQE